MSNKITSLVQQYLQYKRTLGFKLYAEACYLHSFAKYTRDIKYEGTITREIVFQWCESGDNPTLETKGRRFEPLKGLADYANAFDQSAELLPKLPYGNPHQRKRPHIYTLAETCDLIDQCEQLYSPDSIRSLTMKTAIGLLWATGLRTSELVNLTVSDVDFQHCLLYIRSSKFNRDRIVPLTEDVSAQLNAYRRQVEAICNKVHNEPRFFVTTRGKPLKRNVFEYAFQKIRDIIDVSDSDYAHARIYDFRHTFATRIIKGWIEQGIDANKKLYLLSTYMGHIHPEDTYWYLSSTPELLRIVAEKYEYIYGGDANE